MKHYNSIVEAFKPEDKGTRTFPYFEGRPINLYHLSLFVEAAGGYETLSANKGWPKIARAFNLQETWGAKLMKAYEDFIIPIEKLSSTRRKRKATKKPAKNAEAKLNVENSCRGCQKPVGDNASCISCRSVYHLSSLKREGFCPTCHNWTGHFNIENGKGHTHRGHRARSGDTGNIRDVEMQEILWNLLDGLIELAEVERGADKSSEALGNKCQPVPGDPYMQCGQFLKSFAERCGFDKLLEPMSGITAPWAYIGMLFTYFGPPYHNSNLPSINYHRYGKPKMWLSIPESYYTKFTSATGVELSPLQRNDPSFLHQLIKSIGQKKLLKHGIPVRRAEQRRGQFIVTFTGSLYCELNSRFNVCEAAVLDIPKRLPYREEAALISGQRQQNTALYHQEVSLTMREEWRFPEENPLLRDAIGKIAFRELQMRTAFIADSWGSLEEMDPELELKTCAKCGRLLYHSYGYCFKSNKAVCLEHVKWFDCYKTPGLEEHCSKYPHTFKARGTNDALRRLLLHPTQDLRPGHSPARNFTLTSSTLRPTYLSLSQHTTFRGMYANRLKQTLHRMMTCWPCSPRSGGTTRARGPTGASALLRMGACPTAQTEP